MKFKFPLFFFLSGTTVIAACATDLPVFYTKATSPEAIKTSASNRCGQNYHILTYEDDTALIQCLDNRD